VAVLFGASDVEGFGVTVGGVGEDVADGLGDGDTEGDGVGCAEGEGEGEGVAAGACTVMVTPLLVVPASMRAT